MYNTITNKRLKLQGEIQMNNETQAATRAAIYIRVSTDRQAERGYSISEQETKLKAMCTAQGLKVYKVYCDDGYTGSNMERPALKKLLKDVWEGKIKSVVIYKLDRLSRDIQDLLEIIRRIFMPSKTRLISLTESIDTCTPGGRAALNVLATFAELEKDTINERMEMGRIGYVKSGKWFGKVPFGYDRNKEGNLVLNADAIKVRQVFDMYLHGKGLKEIAETLKLTSSESVNSILKSKASHGFVQYRGEYFQGIHEPIISKETYDIAAELRARQKFMQKGSAPSPYVLVGLLYCGKCGSKMAYVKQEHYTKIVCHSTRKSRPHLIVDPNCKNPRLRAVNVEETVLEKLFNRVDGIKDSWSESDTEEKRIALRSRIEKIIVTDGDIDIHWHQGH